jgi:hypothetical protein
MRKSDIAKGDTFLDVIIFIRAVLKGRQIVITVDWHVARESSGRRCRATRGTIVIS